MNNTIYTIGYSGFSIDDFIRKLMSEDIKYIADVRSSPYSKFYSDYNKENIKRVLNQHNIYYENYAVEFGARQTMPQYMNPKGFVDFEKYRKSNTFSYGVDRIVWGMYDGYKIALMCAEKEPARCHRTIMISRWFDLNNFNVVHLMPNKIRSKTQKDIDNELLSHFFKKEFFLNNNKMIFQNSLPFANSDNTKEGKISEAYKKQNALIGFKLDEEEMG